MDKIINFLKSNKSLTKRILILLMALLVVIGILMAQKYVKKPTSKPVSLPTPKGVVKPEEQIKLLKIMPRQVKGEYIFEYEPNSQFFSLEIQNPNNFSKITKEVIDLLKKTTGSQDYCKFGVLVSGNPQKLPQVLKNPYLPGC